MKTISVADLFTEEQTRHIIDVCLSADSLDAAIKELRPWYESLRPQLLAKDLLPEYAAYAVTYAVWNGLQ